MYSELLVMVITEKEGTDVNEAWHSLETIFGSGLVSLVDIVLIRHDASGKISYQMRRGQQSTLDNNPNPLPAAFARTIFDSSRVKERRQLVEAGLDPFFVQQVAEALKPKSLVYLMPIPRDSQIDSRRLLVNLNHEQGRIFHTTFRPLVEEVLLKQTV